MSGICGLFNLDGRSVTGTELRAMTAMLERRGPERTGEWRGEAVSLGYTLLATTPELAIERQPFIGASTGCVITADVRLDNREELHDNLNLRKPLESIGDAELILEAYLKWGEQCPDRLLGDFAFALWDPRYQKLFSARDHFGLRPFYYHFTPRRHFVFASDARVTLVLPQVPYRFNKGRIADFLVPQLEWLDYTSTFFEDVSRLPPGHMLSVSPRGLKISEYWRPLPGPESQRLSDDEYQEGFLEVFSRAVESRLRAPPDSTGSMLSGGMDSGSVVVVAGDILKSGGAESLRTISAVRRRSDDCAESAAIRTSASMQSIVSNFVYVEDAGENLDSLLTGNEEPFDGEAMILKAIYGAAHSLGLRVLLDGAGGDVVLGEGSYIARLFRQGRFLRAVKEIAGENRFWGGGSFVSSAARHFLSAFVPESTKAILRRPRHRLLAANAIRASLISNDFAERIDVEARFERMRKASPGGWIDDYALERCSVIRPSVTAGRERYARLAARSGVEARDPFLDKRVVEFCARLPGRLRMRDGWPKVILRDLMSERLPEDVRLLRGKPHLGWQFNANVTCQAVARGQLDLVQLQEALADYVDTAALAGAWRAMLEDQDAERVHSAHVLYRWLRENAVRPVV